MQTNPIQISGTDGSENTLFAIALAGKGRMVTNVAKPGLLAGKRSADNFAMQHASWLA